MLIKFKTCNLFNKI